MPKTERTPRPYTKLVKDAQGNLALGEDGRPLREQRTRDGQVGWRLAVPAGEDGAEREEVFYGTQRAAANRLRELWGEMETASAPVRKRAKSITVGQAADAFLLGCVWRVPPKGNFPGVRHEQSTVANILNMMDGYIVPGLGQDTKLQKVGLPELIDMVTSRTLQKQPEVPVAPSSMATIAAKTKKFFGWLKQNGYISSDPSENLPAVYSKEASKRSQMDLRLRDVDRLARALDVVWPFPRWARDITGPNGEGYGDVVRLFEYTGVRWEDLVAAPADHVFKRERIMWLQDVATESGGRRDHRTDDGKTRAALRPVILLDEAMPVIERLDAVRRRGADLEPARAERRAKRHQGKRPRDIEPWTLLVCGEQGGFLSYSLWRRKLKQAWDLIEAEMLEEKRAMLAASGASPESIDAAALSELELSRIRITAHMLRHVNASILRAAGASWDFVALQLGHSSGEVARKIYVHPMEIDYVRRAQEISEFRARMQEDERDRELVHFRSRITMRREGLEDVATDSWGAPVPV